MSQNRRETDSDFVALFPSDMVVTKKNIAANRIKFPHTKERKIFTHFLTASLYIKDHEIINPVLSHTRYHPNEWTLEWITEEQS